MGYTQTSKVWVVTNPGAPNHIRHWTELTTEQRDALMAVSEDFAYQIDCGAGKWYEEETELAAFSSSYPSILFVSDSVGEDGDKWRVFARDGKSAKVSATFSFADPELS